MNQYLLFRPYRFDLAALNPQPLPPSPPPDLFLLRNRSFITRPAVRTLPAIVR